MVWCYCLADSELLGIYYMVHPYSSAYNWNGYRFCLLCIPVLLQLLRTGGPKLLDELSLAKQCKIGENISTSGHSLPARREYHNTICIVIGYCNDQYVWPLDT